jgi:tRNA-binding EMAP/Myf-like protein
MRSFLELKKGFPISFDFVENDDKKLYVVKISAGNAKKKGVHSDSPY